MKDIYPEYADEVAFYAVASSPQEKLGKLEAYREDHQEPQEETSVGLAEKVEVLAEEAICPPDLEKTLADFAKAKRINYKRAPDQARAAFFREVRKDLAAQRLSPENESLIKATFEAYLEYLRKNQERAVSETVALIEKGNAQLNFFPADEIPDYMQLRESNPLH